MFQFYFNLNESVPSITDWIQAIAGTIGLFFLVRTLKLQAKATQLQAEVTLIQKEEYLDSIAPDFQFKIEEEPIENGGKVTYTSSKGLATRFRIFNFSTPGVTFEGVVFGKEYKSELYPNVPMTMYYNYDPDNVEIQEIIKEKGAIFIAFQMQFEDKLGNRYSDLIARYADTDHSYLVKRTRKLKMPKNKPWYKFW